MSKVSKILAMALVVLAVITMSFNVNAATSDLKNYVGTPHVINGILFELPNAQKSTVGNHVSTLDDKTSDSVMNDIIAAENIVRNSGVTNVVNMSPNDKAQVIALAKSAADKAGLILSVNTANNTFSLTKKSDGSTLIAGSADALIVNPGTATGGGASAGAPAATPGKTLLYTGANYALYAGVALAIVAVAVVVKKRA